VLTRSQAPATAAGVDHLDRLLLRTATGDLTAFRCLYAFLAVRVWHTAADAFPAPRQALAITRSTFLDIWHTADTAAQYDARDWIEGIAAFRVRERQRLLDGDALTGATVGGRLRELSAYRADRDERTHRELAGLLGPGPAIIRVSPATFIRIENLDLAVAAIAIAAGRRRQGPGPHRHDQPGVKTSGQSARQLGRR